MDRDGLRDEARAVFESVLSAGPADGPVTVLGAGADDLAPGAAFLAALAPGGWVVPTWPPAYGGRDATTDDATVIGEELARFAIPDLYPFLVGLHVIGPTLVALATDEQRRRWLPAIADGTEIWCQLFSEPGAGSDLALAVLGPAGVAGTDPDALEWRTLFLTAPSVSIRGGTDEIQRTIVGEHVLGLPPEPRVDVDRPWNEVPR